MRTPYRKRAEQTVIAVQLDLEVAAFTYRKWGALQTASRGDWLVNNNGDVYTVEQRSFVATYQRVSPGIYFKANTVWAQVAAQAGVVQTKEGQSHYSPGDYLVSNQEDGGDAYCMSADKFNAMYEVVNK